MNAKIGLLPLYIKLYDDSCPELRVKVDAFYETICDEFQKRGIGVVRVPVCRIEDEFEDAIETFEDEDVTAVVTLHLAYSPSLESEKALKKCSLPIIVLDTTPDLSYLPTSDADDINYNHGIHGVMDMCNLLVRNEVNFRIFAGHWTESDVLDRTAGAVKALCIADKMRNIRVGTVGESFKGMGDFAVTEDDLNEDFGIKLIKFDFKKDMKYIDAVSDRQLNEAWEEDNAKYINDDVSESDYKDIMRTSLGIRSWIEDNELDAFTINFLETGKKKLNYMPFDEPCRAMERGIGYAGEGDTLTASLVAALMEAYPLTTFAEMFCPDWKGNTVFLSHMGEYNLAIADGKPHMKMRDFPYTEAGNPFTIIAPMKAGKATYINLAPKGDGTYTLFAVDGEMLDVKDAPDMGEVRGWFKPSGMTLAKFFETYCSYGGTHHGAIVYDSDANSFEPLASAMGWNFVGLANGEKL